MKNKNVRLISKIADVSPATVSRYFNGFEYISNKTKKKIEYAIKKINQIDLNSDLKDGTIGICYLACKDAIDFYSEILDDLLLVLEENRIKATMFVLRKEEDDFNNTINININENITGLVIVGAKISSKTIDRMCSLNIPIILIDNFHEQAHSICVDYPRCIYNAVEVLYDLGHRDIAFVGASKSIYSHSLKYEGYKNAVNKFNLVETVEFYNGGNYYYEGGEMVKNLINKKKIFSAIISTGEMMTIGAANMLNQYGIDVPNDISIIGIGDSNVFDTHNPPITSISIMSEQVALCVLNLYKVTRGDTIKAPVRMYVTPIINKRSSCIPINGFKKLKL